MTRSERAWAREDEMGWAAEQAQEDRETLMLPASLDTALLALDEASSRLQATDGRYAEDLDAIRAARIETLVVYGWTRETTQVRRAAWNTRQVTTATQVQAERELGFRADDLRRAVRLYEL